MSKLVRRIKSKGKKILNAILPSAVKSKREKIPVGQIDFGDLRRLRPIDPDWGFSRGQVIDRYYIEQFLALCAGDVRGRVLEFSDNTYTKKYGADKVSRSDIMHYVEGNPKATIVGDLTKADHIESNLFECIIFTQTLQMIYDVHAALKHLHRILKPGGVVLMTTHGTSKICRVLGKDPWGEYWRFTRQSLQVLFDEHFKAGEVKIEVYGNVLAATAFLHGITAQELSEAELNYRDPEFEVVLGVRAAKAKS